MPKLIAMGEMLIDFTSSRPGLLKTAPSFVKNPGGAPANVAVCNARLGGTSAVITCLGQDAFGDFLSDTLKDNGVDTSSIVRSKTHRTPLAFVSLTGDGERDFTFYRSDSSDLFLKPGDIHSDVFTEGDVLHFGSVDLVDFPVKKAHEKAIKLAHQKNCIVSFDPNLRFNLWPSAESLRTTVCAFVPFAHILKLSVEELRFLTNIEDVDTAVSTLFQGKVILILVTNGARGATLYAQGEMPFHVAGEAVVAIDATGAGDAFIGTFLHLLIKNGKTVSTLTKNYSEYATYLRKANHVAAIVCTRYGAIPALPYAYEANL